MKIKILLAIALAAIGIFLSYNGLLMLILGDIWGLVWIAGAALAFIITTLIWEADDSWPGDWGKPGSGDE